MHFAIDYDMANRLVLAGDDKSLATIVVEEIESEWDEEWSIETDKAWDALHRCLSNGTLNPSEGEPPLNKCFFGGRVLNRGPEYFVVLLLPSEVDQIAQALSDVTKEWLRKRYLDLEFPDYQQGKSEEDWEYTWHWFQGLPPFFERAAREKRHVIFTVDQ